MPVRYPTIRRSGTASDVPPSERLRMPLIPDTEIGLKKSINKPEPTFIRNYNSCFNLIEKMNNVQAYRVAYGT